MTTASAAFALAGLLTLVLAIGSDEGRLVLGALAAASGAAALALLTLARRSAADPAPLADDEEAPERWTLDRDQPAPR